MKGTRRKDVTDLKKRNCRLSEERETIWIFLVRLIPHTKETARMDAVIKLDPPEYLTIYKVHKEHDWIQESL